MSPTITASPDKLYHNNRDGTFTDVIDRVLPHTSSSSMGSDLGDVNNDGLIDFLVADMASTTHFRGTRGPWPGSAKAKSGRIRGDAQVPPQRPVSEHGNGPLP
jgi:hypothetical protein